MKNWLPAELGRWLRAMEMTPAALDHEPGDDPVEDGAIIETLLYQVDEVVHRVGGHLGIELHLDDAPGGLDGDDGILHWKFPPLQSVGAGWARPWNVKVL